MTSKFSCSSKKFLLILGTKTATKSDAGKYGCSLIYLKDCFSSYKSKNNVFDVEIHMKMSIYMYITAYLIFYYEEFTTATGPISMVDVP